MSWIVSENDYVEQTYDNLTDMLYDLISRQYERYPYDIVILVDNLYEHEAIEIPFHEGVYTIGYISLAIAELTTKMNHATHDIENYFYAIADALADKVVDAIVENGEYKLFDVYTIKYSR
jgi:hypothetical protein